MAKRRKWCILALAQLHLLDFQGVGVKGLLFHFILSKVQLQVRNRLRVPAYFVVFFFKDCKAGELHKCARKKVDETSLSSREAIFALPNTRGLNLGLEAPSVFFAYSKQSNKEFFEYISKIKDNPVILIKYILCLKAMTRFVLRAASSLIWGNGDLLFHFIQSKVVGLQET